MPEPASKLISLLRWALLLTLGVILLAELWLSLAWRMGTDSPLLHYVAFLINEHDFVPYRDVFETSMPGTFLFHLAIVKLVGYSEAAFRVVDIAFVLLAMFLAWLTVRQINTLAAAAGALGFALLYMGYAIDLQRDYVGFVAMLAALYFATRQYANIYIAPLLMGLFSGVAAAIKPQLAIGLPVLLVFYTAQVQDIKTAGWFGMLVRFALTSGLALIAVVALPLAWLAANGGLASFWEMATQYLPLHVDMTGNIETVTAEEKLAYIRKKLARDLPFFLVPASIGVAIALLAGELDRRQRQLVLVLAALAICYIIATILASQFWLYHWLPFRILAVLCTALALVPLRPFKAKPLVEAALLGLFCVALMTWTRTLNPLALKFYLPPAFAGQLRGEIPQPPSGGRVDEIAAFLRDAGLQPNDRVQPLDWTEGSLHAMLLSETVAATPFIYNYHFYHYISNPYIQEMRKRLLSELNEGMPRFLIEVDDELRPTGLDTTDSFVELEDFVQQHYVVALQGEGYRIYELQHDSK